MSLSNGNLYFIDPDKARSALARAALVEREHANLYQIVVQVLPRQDGKEVTARIRNAIHGALPSGMSINYDSGTITIWRQGGDVEPSWSNRFSFKLEQNPDTLKFDCALTLGADALQHYASAAKRLTEAALLAEQLDERIERFNLRLRQLKAAYDELGYFRHVLTDVSARGKWSGL